MTNPYEHRAVGNVVNETARRKVRQAQRIRELEDQVTRLQQALIDVVDHYVDLSFDISLDTPGEDTDALRNDVQLWLHKHSYLANWHDLDPVKGDDHE